MNRSDFDNVIREKVGHEKVESKFQNDWTRQRNTAYAFIERFGNGFDTQLLADEVGMGKTYVAMAMIGAMLRGRPGRAGRALLVTPSSAVLRSKWEQELRSFGDRYMGSKSGAKAPLRPLVITDYWQLVANLHDYDADPVGRVTERLRGGIVASFWEWCRRVKLVGSRTRFNLDISFDPHAPEARAFASDFSSAAWWSYLDTLKAGQEPLLRQRVAQLSDQDPQVAAWAFRWLAEAFRKFTDKQNEHVPDVLIVGMSSLRRPNYNQQQSLEFYTFVVGVLLSGLHEPTRKAFVRALRKAGNVILDDATHDSVRALAAADLYRTKGCIAAVMQDDDALQAEWRSLKDAPEAGRMKAFLRTLTDAVISRKLKESGIKLAVIDEAHNWKDGKNGGGEFKKIFAPAIPRKLLMSATPFQLAENEMLRVFAHAADPSGRTQQVLASQGEAVSQCLAANASFARCWTELAASGHAVQALHTALAGADVAAVEARLSALAEHPTTDPALAAFCQAALVYRKAVDKLVAIQRQIVIRHVKPRGHRAFHAGVDFRVDVLPQQKTALYGVIGMADGDDAFIHYLAMRMDQQIRGIDSQASAHLMGGLTSSVAAYQKSVHGRRALPRGADVVTRGYVGMFGKAMQHHAHPKVGATVRRALENYHNGRKTLIFCERVDTLEEIQTGMRQAMESVPAGARRGSDPVQARKDFLEHAEVADLRLTRLAWLASGRHVGLRARIETLRPEAATFAIETLARIGLNPTARRVHRLMDILALARLDGSPAEAGHLARHFEALCAACRKASVKDRALWQSIFGGTRAEAQAGAQAIHDEAMKHAATWFGDVTNVWEADDAAEFAAMVLGLLDSESAMLQAAADPKDPAAPADTATAFYDTVVALQRGVRKVVLRPDLFRGYLADAGWSGGTASEITEIAAIVHDGIRRNRGQGESPWRRVCRFMQALCDANGSINPHATTNTQRRSLWRGVNIRASRQGVNDEEGDALVTDDDLAVQTLSGDTDAERRIALCAAFNSPLAPDVLICTSIGSEGIDLHRECAEVIHHDLPWNPAKLEQRIGRVDRVGSLGEERGIKVRIGIPFQEQTYERFQYNVLLARAQRFQVLLGKPDFDVATDEEDPEAEDGRVREIDGDDEVADATLAPELPAPLLQWLSVDLALPTATAPALPPTPVTPNSRKEVEHAVSD
ncbi:RNA polymerase-associated protein RapA [Cupriavidus laharis]|uniref:RNA polymerase-associated protein RapA n=1 Tax=Cupriavidus laharis TaxID=151654 RepID=A0ABM8WY54_9BURK|nr:helicase-related protein [Cupriavidus laharis]CAG9172485.1 RNA polymerase-associated protein RapA [Cupriavidus laharis]